MAIPEPSCCDGPNELLRKILQGLPFIGGGGGNDIIVQDEGIVLTTSLSTLNFVGAGVTATAVGDVVTVTIPGGGAASTLQSGSQNINNGVDTISVVFPVAYAVAPVVVATMSRPVAENLIEVNIDQASITVNGFTCSLSSTTASANYKLKWMAN